MIVMANEEIVLYHGSNVVVEKPQMTNLFFPDEQISKDDVYFVCYMIERIARQLKQPKKYVANAMGHDELAKKLSLADTLHSENPLAVEADWTDEYSLQPGEDYADAILRVYNNSICDIIDNYNSSAFYEPSQYIARSYYSGSF